MCFPRASHSNIFFTVFAYLAAQVRPILVQRRPEAYCIPRRRGTTGPAPLPQQCRSVQPCQWRDGQYPPCIARDWHPPQRAHAYLPEILGEIFLHYQQAGARNDNRARLYVALPTLPLLSAGLMANQIYGIWPLSSRRCTDCDYH
jgi:hypothetical protein